MAGLLKYASDITVFSPLFNSYKRFAKDLCANLHSLVRQITGQPLLDWLAKAVSLYVLVPNTWI